MGEKREVRRPDLTSSKSTEKGFTRHTTCSSVVRAGRRITTDLTEHCLFSALITYLCETERNDPFDFLERTKNV